MLNPINELNGHYVGGNGRHTNGNGHVNRNGTGKDVAVLPAGKTAEKLAIETAVRTILDNVGEDSQRDGLIGTPDRIARMFDEVLGGYGVDPVKLVNGALFDVDYSEMVLVRDIEYFSMCEHHMLPFYGRAHVA